VLCWDTADRPGWFELPWLLLWLVQQVHAAQVPFEISAKHHLHSQRKGLAAAPRQKTLGLLGLVVTLVQLHGIQATAFVHLNSCA
jgi:hypothetical protein